MDADQRGTLVRLVDEAAVPPATLDELRKDLDGSPRLAGAAASGAPPILWFRLASEADAEALRATLQESSRLVFLPWGWDFEFGPLLTISVTFAGRSGPTPSVAVAPDCPIFGQLQGGAFVAVFGVGHRVVAVVAVDLDDMPMPPPPAGAELPDPGTGRFYSTQWSAVRDFATILVDPHARYWESIRYRTIFEKHLTAAERLSVAWVDEYSRDARRFVGTLDAMRRDGALNGLDVSTAPADLEPFVNALRIV
jgi:hypothetical protein